MKLKYYIAYLLLAVMMIVATGITVFLVLERNSLN